MEDELYARGLHLRTVREETRSCDFIASTDDIDRYDEVVEQSWQLDRYMKNPVVLFAHNSRDLPIGHASNVGVVDGALQCTVTFVSEKANPLAEKVWNSVKEKSLRAVSVGFRPKTVRFEKRNDKEVYVLADNELLEVSVCAVPANPNALAKMKAKALETARSRAKEQNMLEEKEAEKLRERVATAEADVKTTKDALVKSEKDLADTRKLLGDEQAKVATLTQERDAMKQKLAAADEKIVEHDVDAMVGVKITPDERDEMVEFAKADRTRFDKVMAKRPAMKLLQPVITDERREAGPAPTTGGDDDGKALASKIFGKTG